MIYNIPNPEGKYGKYGGRFVPELLMPALLELEEDYLAAKKDKTFQDEVNYYLTQYVGRKTPLYKAENLTNKLGGAQVYLKREDLNHTGAHKINNAIAQALLAKRMGKKKIVAETGAGQHGVATATVCALLDLDCIIFMGDVDIKRQEPNVFRMELLGAEVRSVSSGSKTLKDAVNEALRYWVANVEDTHYILGSVVRPHSFPMIVRDFQSVIGTEAKQQFKDLTGSLPNAFIASVGGGSNAMGLFYPFIDDEHVKFYGIEACGLGIPTHKHSSSVASRSTGILHGTMTELLQDPFGQITEAFLFQLDLIILVLGLNIAIYMISTESLMTLLQMKKHWKLLNYFHISKALYQH